ncbi:MAG TPA: bifunctional phosphoribosyl-AMP cyclohydrolase/phosphoribosyl-ATP diphosphatase HisIE [Gemmatimonadaceae bacterium]|nr:bifunctional phosphoribosyl-AMP cyclohydrolase/phosphoribosyl-ATP diphosphatase HisIE [Gemmatimonadaceae bacterium]
MTRILSAADVDRLDFAKGDGMVTVVTQDARTGVVLMVAHADRAALDETLATAEMHYRSRSRGLWHKGATSGNVQRAISLDYDCDADAVLARVIPAGPACHTGAVSCFEENPAVSAAHVFARLAETIHERAASANDAPSYTRKLLDDRNLRLKKIGEEASELVLACADADADRAAEEAADLIYHTVVALEAVGVPLAAVADVLSRRMK